MLEIFVERYSKTAILILANNNMFLHILVKPNLAISFPEKQNFTKEQITTYSRVNKNFLKHLLFWELYENSHFLKKVSLMEDYNLTIFIQYQK